MTQRNTAAGIPATPFPSPEPADGEAKPNAIEIISGMEEDVRAVAELSACLLLMARGSGSGLGVLSYEERAAAMVRVATSVHSYATNVAEHCEAVRMAGKGGVA